MTPLAELASLTDSAWLVGGAVRDELLGRSCTDFDLALEGDARRVARSLGRATGANSFALSDAFGAWRVTAADRSWQVDLTPLTGATLEADLANRDLTINAIARPVGGGELIDPFGGAKDLAARRLKMVSDASFVSDPLRVVRLARLAAGLGFEIDPATLAAAGSAAAALPQVAGERLFAELKQIVAGEDPVKGLSLLASVGALAVLLPELDALHGVEQSAYHHLDVYEHTLAVLEYAAAPPLSAPGLEQFLDQPLADDMSRREALRWGALMHDIAKPQTQGVSPEGKITFYGHDEQGAELARGILSRLRASERLISHVGALTRHHLTLGFMVHRQPLSARDVYDYLARTEPVGVDVTLLSVADRLATRGRNAERAIDKHVALATEILPAALDWQSDRPRSPIRGDVLATALGREPGPWLSGAIDELTRARYAGEIEPTPEAAVEHARAWLE
ncbi:MAG: HDIG domain-containing protein [Solirubrobacterales bacterium]|nr:HDIG domain-containing protein [Solirubrobacterales bacterium]